MPNQSPSDEQIRSRAYELYLSRKDSGGSDLEDWVRAEQELRAGMATPGKGQDADVSDAPESGTRKEAPPEVSAASENGVTPLANGKNGTRTRTTSSKRAATK